MLLSPVDGFSSSGIINAVEPGLHKEKNIPPTYVKSVSRNEHFVLSVDICREDKDWQEKLDKALQEGHCSITHMLELKLQLESAPPSAIFPGAVTYAKDYAPTKKQLFAAASLITMVVIDGGLIYAASHFVVLPLVHSALHHFALCSAYSKQAALMTPIADPAMVAQTMAQANSEAVAGAVDLCATGGMYHYTNKLVRRVNQRFGRVFSPEEEQRLRTAMQRLPSHLANIPIEICAVSIPDLFEGDPVLRENVCPISLCSIHYPLRILATGHVYEFIDLVRWILVNQSDPTTRARLSFNQVAYDWDLSDKIQKRLLMLQILHAAEAKQAHQT